jgi:hypothetical protein
LLRQDIAHCQSKAAEFRRTVHALGWGFVIMPLHTAISALLRSPALLGDLLTAQQKDSSDHVKAQPEA